MRHEYSSSPGFSDTPGITLHTIWRVEADESYDISVETSRATSAQIRAGGGSGLIAIRTLSGAGRIYLGSEGVVEASPDTLILMDWNHLERYHCRSTHWSFWWFEFSTTGLIHAPLNCTLPVPCRPSEEPDLDYAYTLLRSEPPEMRRLATATFEKALYSWLADWRGTWAVSPDQKVVWGIIEQMHQRLDQRWTVREMAELAGMSPRSFLEAFEGVVGDSPKRFYDRLRITLAQEWLQLGLCGVKEISDRFGFSSPYHFSKAFLRHTGMRPSAVCRRTRVVRAQRKSRAADRADGG